MFNIIYILSFYRIPKDKAYGELFLVSTFSTRAKAVEYYDSQKDSEYYTTTPLHIVRRKLDDALLTGKVDAWSIKS